MIPEPADGIDVRHEGVLWTWREPRMRRGPYGEDAGMGPPAWACRACPRVTVVRYPTEEGAIFSGWRVLYGGCGVSENDLTPTDAFEYGNRYAAEIVEDELLAASTDLRDAEERFEMIQDIATATTERAWPASSAPPDT